MDQNQRQKRLRLLVSKFNKERKKQAKKIDMLCNDLIMAQRDFIKKLNAISFAADFYKSLIGINDLSRLLSAAQKLIKNEIAETNVSFFLRNTNSSGAQLSESNKSITAPTNQIENYFTAEVTENICKANKICSLEEMFAMGLQGNLVELNKISAFAIPLSQLGRSLGFILIYRPSENKLTSDELNKISAITCGLSRAIQSYKSLSHVNDVE
ncbi:MAG: hypothetical protein A2167_08280 [Planctomycetes bacterium RBG_13_46_10]|nr:MAG: hypothetical protein A2167_08280 [Planctomycetes bacterium RBG_13_46_10]